MYYIPSSYNSSYSTSKDIQNNQNYSRNYKLPAPFIVQKSTANSLPLIDSENIRIITEKFTLSVPQYKNLNTMIIKLNEVIDNID
jgi:hypothetical protein